MDQGNIHNNKLQKTAHKVDTERIKLISEAFQLKIQTKINKVKEQFQLA